MEALRILRKTAPEPVYGRIARAVELDLLAQGLVGTVPGRRGYVLTLRGRRVLQEMEGEA